jgi:hypothetical protein
MMPEAARAFVIVHATLAVLATLASIAAGATVFWRRAWFGRAALIARTRGSGSSSSRRRSAGSSNERCTQASSPSRSPSSQSPPQLHRRASVPKPPSTRGERRHSPPSSPPCSPSSRRWLHSPSRPTSSFAEPFF